MLRIWRARATSGVRYCAYITVLVASLLVATGYFHFKLALPTARTRVGATKLAAALALALWTHHLLWVCAGAVVFEWLESLWSEKEVDA
jgi:hypothetical protein